MALSKALLIFKIMFSILFELNVSWKNIQNRRLLQIENIYYFQI